ncbi:MAG: hypothetical protein JXB88_19075 [Spirochaetales bacterium]|nr:hypothetical protein [Spirochaetales bacterium]
MKKIVLLSVSIMVLGLLSGCVSTTKLPAGTDILENFEDTHFFIAVGNSWGDGDNSTAALTSDKHATSGSKSLECQFALQENKKGGAFYGEGFEPFNWTGYSNLIVDIFNATGTDLELAIAVCSGTAWEWQESINFPLPSGQNKDITINLKEGNFKSSLTGWENNGILLYMEDVKRLVFKILGPPGVEGSVFIDYIRLAQ